MKNKLIASLEIITNKETRSMNDKNNKTKNISLSESRQMAFTYIIYMMVGSYFKHMVCKDTDYMNAAEKEYFKLTEEEQIFLETQIIRYSERQLLKGLTERIWKEAVSVEAKKYKKDSQCIKFKGKDFELTFLIDHADGRGAIIRTGFADHKNKVLTDLIRTILRNRTEVWYHPDIKEKMQYRGPVAEEPVNVSPITANPMPNEKTYRKVS